MQRRWERHRLRGRPPAARSWISRAGSGVTRPDAGSFSCFRWWMGDGIGVLIFAPLLLRRFGAPAAVWRARQLAVGVPLAITFALTVAVFCYASHWENDRARADFERQ